MNWFEQICGFRETYYADTQSKLSVSEGRLTSLVNGRSFGVGMLELVSLRELRERLNSSPVPRGRLKANVIRGDARLLHHATRNRGALFQVASQFNLLEMTGPNVFPENGVAIYEQDHTQGPACAIAAGAATIYRNYFVPFSDGYGQTKTRQLDGLRRVGEALSAAIGIPVENLWTMKNGYALSSREELTAIDRHLASINADELDALRAELAIGMHWDVEVTDAPSDEKPTVSQAFCSALPVFYNSLPVELWARFAQLVLEAAYEATLTAAALNARRGASNRVLLTSLGGGVFGNRESWIHAAISRAFDIASDFDLQVELVSYSTPSRAFLQLAEAHK